MMVSVALISHEVFFKHNLKSHPENASRLSYFIKSVVNFPIQQFEAEDVELSILHRVHTPEYVAKVKETSENARKWGPSFLDPDTYCNSFTYEAAIKASGALVQAVKLTKEGYRYVVCAVRPPGHHAERDKAMGFCIFNNVAVGVVAARELGYQRAFIIDFDAHHGNGTQSIFYNDTDVFYLSSHQYPFYPGTGGTAENNEHILNFPLPAGTKDDEFEKIYGEYMPQAMNMFEPDIVFVSAGFDLHVEDPMTELEATDEGIRFILEQIKYNADTFGVPIIFALEGGYNYSVLERCGEMLYEVLTQ